MQKDNSITYSTNTISYMHYNLPIDFPCTAILQDGEISRHNVINDNTSQIGHFHNCIELGFCKNCDGSLILENDAFPLYAGDYCFIPENIAHHLVLKAPSLEDTKNSWETIVFDPYLLFNNSLPEAELDELLMNLADCSCIISADTDRELHMILECIFSEMYKKEPYYQDSLKGLLLSLLMLIKRNKKGNYSCKSDYQWLYSALNHIRKNYHQKLNIAEIANKCCSLSESHFRKRFGEIMHISPLDYINQYRIRIACQLIYQNDKPLNKIAGDVGFSTLSSFNRNFHKLLGCSPREWRKQPIIKP